MASNDNNDDWSRQSDNPFITFRRLIDSHISSAIHSLNEQAGITTSPTPHSQERPQAKQTPDEGLSSLFNIFGQPPLHGLAMSRAQNPHEPTQTVAPSHTESQLWPCILPRTGSQPLQKPIITLDAIQQAEHLMYGLTEFGTFAWWRHYSPYAPTNLIHDKELPEHLRTKWHPAFYDLMNFHNKEEKEPALARLCHIMWHADETAENMEGDVHTLQDKQNLDWSEETAMWSHEEEDFFSPRVVIRNAARRRAQGLEEDGLPATEEDMYNGFLTQQQQLHNQALHRVNRVFDEANQGRNVRDDSVELRGKSTKEASDSDDWGTTMRFVERLMNPSRNANEQELREKTAQNVMEAARATSMEQDPVTAAAETSPIISMVTTSHTSTLPDGSSRTVKRWKRTFADGREESNEDVQDSPGRPQDARPAVEQPKKENKGWFWN